MTEIRAISTVTTDLFGTSTVTITLTQAEAALVHHVRGNCHDSTICALCEACTKNTALMQRVSTLFGENFALRGRARRAERQLDRIISG